ncbi:MAG: hypothetical protein IPL79_10470 [Myxococcales bacterium]|nr:hypothetical protein [Myxococcales bacterium]
MHLERKNRCLVVTALVGLAWAGGANSASAQACHAQPTAPGNGGAANGGPPKLYVATSVTTRFASFHRTVGAGQVLTLIPGVTVARGPLSIYGDVTLSTRSFRGDVASAHGNWTFGAAGTWWTQSPKSGQRVGVTIDVAGMAPGGRDQLLADDHWMVMPAVVGHVALRAWRFDLGAMYHHSFVSGDHSSDFHILNVVRPMRHRGESFTFGATHTVSPRVAVDVSGVVNVSSSLQIGSAGLAYAVSDGLQLTTRIGMVSLFSKLDPVVSVALARAW